MYMVRVNTGTKINEKKPTRQSAALREKKTRWNIMSLIEVDMSSEES